MTHGPYTAVYTFEDGNWLVHIDELEQVHTFARTLVKAEAMIKDALALWLEVPVESVTLQVRYDLDKSTISAVTRSRQARYAAEVAQREANGLTRLAAMALAHLGLSVRDSAQLLGLSFQRVQQLVSETNADFVFKDAAGNTWAVEAKATRDIGRAGVKSVQEAAALKSGKFVTKKAPRKRTTTLK